MPFFGIKPELLDGKGKVLEGEAEGALCIADSWPGQMRGVWGDTKRFAATYFSTFKVRASCLLFTACPFCSAAPSRGHFLPHLMRGGPCIGRCLFTAPLWLRKGCCCRSERWTQGERKIPATPLSSHVPELPPSPCPPPQGKYFSGDGARRDKDGYYWITGRVDDVINVSGHRLGTAEVESALVGTGKVAEAAVVGFPHDIKGQGIYGAGRGPRDRPFFCFSSFLHVFFFLRGVLPFDIKGQGIYGAETLGRSLVFLSLFPSLCLPGAGHLWCGGGAGTPGRDSLFCLFFPLPTPLGCKAYMVRGGDLGTPSSFPSPLPLPCLHRPACYQGAGHLWYWTGASERPFNLFCSLLGFSFPLPSSPPLFAGSPTVCLLSPDLPPPPFPSPPLSSPPAAFVTLKAGHEASEALRQELVAGVRKAIGPIATPDVIQVRPDKT